MKRRTIYWILGAAAVGAVGWYMTMSKQAYAKAIVKNGMASSYVALLRFDKEYLKEWAKAARLGTSTFLYNGAVYVTKGGKVQKGAK